MIRTWMYLLFGVIFSAIPSCCFADDTYVETRLKKVVKFKQVEINNETDIFVRVRVCYRKGFSLCEKQKIEDVWLSPGGRYVFKYDDQLSIWNKYLKIGGSKLKKIQAGQVWDISTLLTKRVG